SSQNANGAYGAAHQLLLEHVLANHQSYELPLRTMYTINCAPDQSSKQPDSPASPGPDRGLAEAFTANLMTQVQQLPNQPTSLPPSFVTSFLLRTFHPELTCVDFPQALTGLDYLRDLEMRRRHEISMVLGQLHGNNVSSAIKQWGESIAERGRKVEGLYSQLYLSLRRWIMINELYLSPFNKRNCMAMLNTLYPPVVAKQPSSTLSPEVLAMQRQGIFKYINSVDKQGRKVLTNLMNQGKGPADETGWPAVNRTLSNYLHQTNAIINECTNMDFCRSPITKSLASVPGTHQKPLRKADSGVSFGSAHSANRVTGLAEPESPRSKTPVGGRPSTTLEKIARGLKAIGRGRTDEQTYEPPTPALPSSASADKTLTERTSNEKITPLRKMRSMGAIGSRK
ncbi:hypothetical protein K470DRAFT_207318, partial [Piedraia hortae CBS 480.64]